MKHVMRILILVVVSVLLFNPVASSSAQSQPDVHSQPAVPYDQNVRFEHILVEDGLPHATVLAVLQDQDGFMWFTTADGLARYDGSNFTIFRQQVGENSLSNNNTFSLDPNQGWIDLDWYRPGRSECVRPANGAIQSVC